MISKNNVVLILGAGASQPYGFPSGPALVELIKNMNVKGCRQFSEASQGKFTTDEAVLFGTELRASGRDSIDRFLQRRGNLEKIGKAMIAYHLLPVQRVIQLTTPGEGKWYPYLYNRVMNPSTPEKFGNNQLSIITYNYDCSLEKYLSDAVRASFGLSENDASNLVSTIPIVHVHGSFAARPYNHRVDGFVKASSDLRIVSDDIEQSGVLDECARLLTGATHVVFLGFGYDPVNIDRLRLERTVGSTSVHGTAYGLETAEIELIKNSLIKRTGVAVQNAPRDVDCLLFFQRLRQIFV